MEDLVLDDFVYEFVLVYDPPPPLEFVPENVVLVEVPLPIVLVEGIVEGLLVLVPEFVLVRDVVVVPEEL